MKKVSLVAFAGTILPLIGLAHEGHGVTDGFTITHYFVEPEHALYTLGVIAVGIGLFSYYKLKKNRAAK